MPFMNICCLREWRQWPYMEEKVHRTQCCSTKRCAVSAEDYCLWRKFLIITTRWLSANVKGFNVPCKGKCSLVKMMFVHWFSDQEERTKAIEAFKEGKKDVLVATDVASKGLDFPAIQHVVNYDMPEEIENYGKRAHASGVGIFCGNSFFSPWKNKFVSGKKYLTS